MNLRALDMDTQSSRMILIEQTPLPIIKIADFSKLENKLGTVSRYILFIIFKIQTNNIFRLGLIRQREEKKIKTVSGYKCPLRYIATYP